MIFRATVTHGDRGLHMVTQIRLALTVTFISVVLIQELGVVRIC